MLDCDCFYAVSDSTRRSGAAAKTATYLENALLVAECVHLSKSLCLALYMQYWLVTCQQLVIVSVVTAVIHVQYCGRQKWLLDHSW